MLLTRDEQKALDATYLELHSLRAETRMSTIAAQMDAKRREQRSQPMPCKSALELQMDRERRQKREEREEEAERMMAKLRSDRQRAHNATPQRPTQRYSNKAFTDVSTQQRLYEIKSLVYDEREQRYFEQEYQRVLHEKGPEQAHGMACWYHSRLLKGIHGF